MISPGLVARAAAEALTLYSDSPMTSIVNHHVSKSSALTRLMPAMWVDGVRMGTSACGGERQTDGAAFDFDFS